MLLSPGPIWVLFFIFPLMNSVFTCRTGWTPPRKSRSRSGVSGRLWLGMRWKGGQGSRPWGRSCAALSYFGKCIQILEFICSMEDPGEDRA